MLKRLMKFAALALLAAFLLTGCLDFSAMTGAMDTADSDEPKATQPPLTDPMYTDREALYQYYNRVNIGDQRADIVAKFGEPEIETTDNGETCTWQMEDGYGFAAVFFDSGRAEVCETIEAEPGDLIALWNGQRYYHVLVVVRPGTDPRVAAHTHDVLDRPLSDYCPIAHEALHIL